MQTRINFKEIVIAYNYKKDMWIPVPLVVQIINILQQLVDSYLDYLYSSKYLSLSMDKSGHRGCICSRILK